MNRAELKAILPQGKFPAMQILRDDVWRAVRLRFEDLDNPERDCPVFDALPGRSQTHLVFRPSDTGTNFIIVIEDCEIVDVQENESSSADWLE